MQFKKTFLILIIHIGLAYSLLCYQCEYCTRKQTNYEIINCNNQICYLGIKNDLYFQGCIKSVKIDKLIRSFDSNKICDIEFCNKNYDTFGRTSKNWSLKLNNNYFLSFIIVLLQTFIK